jgi:hypothetical protein
LKERLVYLCFHFLEKKERQKATGKCPSFTNQLKETGSKAPKLDYLYKLQKAKPKIDKIYLDKLMTLCMYTESFSTKLFNIPSEDS